MAWSQDDLIFPIHAVAAPGPLPPRSERLEVATPDGETLHGVHVPPARATRRPPTLILGFGGNAWNADDVASYLHEVYPDAHVIAFHYRGYRPSTGRPSAEALVADAPLVFDASVERVKPKKVVVVGLSIGSGVAAALAADRDVDGLILVTPFDSLKAVAQQLYPWLPVGLLFRHEFDAAGYLSGNMVPTAIIGGERDGIIPPSRTDSLRSKVPNLVYDRTIPGAGHNDIYARSQFQRSMDEALAAVSK